MATGRHPRPGAGIPGFGDTVTIVTYTVTVPASTTADIGTAGSTAITLGNGTVGGGLTVAGTLDLRGTISLTSQFYDCSNALKVTIATGGLLELDENGTSNASGMVIASTKAPCVDFTIGSPGDSCTWGSSSPTCPTKVVSINNGSANGVLLLDSGTGSGASATNWNGFEIDNCGSASVPCYQPEMYNNALSSWAWSQGVLSSDSWFGPQFGFGIGSDLTPVTIDSVVSIGTRLENTDIYFGGQCTHGAYGAFNSSTAAGANLTTKACRGARSITNSFITDMRSDGSSSDIFTAGATIQNVFFDGLKSGGSLPSSSIAGGSWDHVVIYGNNDGTTSAYGTILAPVANYVYVMTSGPIDSETVGMAMESNNGWGTNVSLSHVIFDDQAHGTGSHCGILAAGGAADSGYSFNASYMTVTLDSVSDFAGCTALGWSGGCQAAPNFSVSHTLFPAPSNGVSPWYFCDDSNIATTAPELNTWYGNIYYSTSVSTYPVGLVTPEATQPANLLSPTGTDYNDNYLATTFTSGTAALYNACSGGACTNIGSPYGLPMTGSAPGPHDITTNPGLLDNTRNAYKWAALKGQSANAAGFRQAFINDGPQRIGANISSLFAYIDQGDIPTTALWNNLPDHTTMGASQPVMFPMAGSMRTAVQ